MHFHRCSTLLLRSSSFPARQIRREYFFRNLFNHFQFARRAEEQLKKKGIDLNNLTAAQEEKLKPLFRMRKAFQLVNVVTGAMGVIALLVWLKRKKTAEKQAAQIEETFQPIWFDLKSFKHKAALVQQFLLPEQIVSKLNALNSFQFRSTDVICASFPKSGTTLLQELLDLLVHDFDFDQVKRKDLADRCPFLEWPTTNLKQLDKQPVDQRRLFKTHLPPRFFNQSFPKAKVLFSLFIKTNDRRGSSASPSPSDRVHLSESEGCLCFFLSFSPFDQHRIDLLRTVEPIQSIVSARRRFVSFVSSEEKNSVRSSSLLRSVARPS